MGSVIAVGWNYYESIELKSLAQYDYEQTESNTMAKQIDEQAVQPTTPLTLTTEQLMLLLNESKKPSAEEQVRIAKALANARRTAEATAAQQEEIRQNRLFQITNCSHIRGDGKTRAVFIKGQAQRVGDLGYLHCQKCHANIYPEQTLKHMPKSHILGAIYDTQLFNRLFQMATKSSVSD
jgi:hypothetical protein